MKMRTVLIFFMTILIYKITALLGNDLSSKINLFAELTLYGKYREIPDFLFFKTSAS